jgi:hypothetical protein
MNFWDVQLDDADVIIFFGVPEIMERLQKKMLEEMHDDGLAVSHKFPVTGWTPMMTVHNHAGTDGENVTTGSLYMYNIGEQRRGRSATE